MIITEQQKIIKKFKMLSDKYHNLSLLFNELSKSLEIEYKRKSSLKEFKIYLKSLNLDFDKIKSLSLGLSELCFNDLKGGKKE